MCEPGDVLYLPPDLAHYGVAADACMTYSVGFRAPSATALVDAAFAAIPGEGPLYADPGVESRANAGEITRRDFERMRHLFATVMQNAEVRRSLADAVTLRSRPVKPSGAPTGAREAGLRKDTVWRRNPAVRSAFFFEESGSVYFSYDGRGSSIDDKHSISLVTTLCRGGLHSGDELARIASSPAAKKLLRAFVREGLFVQASP